MSDIIIAADVVNHMMQQKGFKEILNDSIHASKPTPIVNLSPKNLKHKLNKLYYSHCNNQLSH